MEKFENKSSADTEIIANWTPFDVGSENTEKSAKAAMEKVLQTVL